MSTPGGDKKNGLRVQCVALAQAGEALGVMSAMAVLQVSLPSCTCSFAGHSSSCGWDTGAGPAPAPPLPAGPWDGGCAGSCAHL